MTHYRVESAALHITAACDAACAFCYMADVRKQRPQHPPLDRLKRIMDALAEANVEEVSFVGGDPGIYPRVFELAKYGADQGLRIGILSNTHAYPGSSVTQMSRYVSAFETTLHASTASAHDAFCAMPGVYDSVMAKLREAKESSRNVGLTLNITPQTADNLFDIVDAAVNRENVQADYAVIQRIIPFGAAKNKSDFALSPEHARAAVENLDRIHKEFNIDLSICDPLPLCVLPDHLKKYMTPCQWGLTVVSVDDRGNLSRCGADPRGTLGNILKTPLLDIWNNSQDLKDFREQKYLATSCRACPDRAACGGGCPLSGNHHGACGPDCLI